MAIPTTFTNPVSDEGTVIIRVNTTIGQYQDIAIFQQPQINFYRPLILQPLGLTPPNYIQFSDYTTQNTAFNPVLYPTLAGANVFTNINTFNQNIKLLNGVSLQLGTTSPNIGYVYLSTSTMVLQNATPNGAIFFDTADGGGATSSPFRISSTSVHMYTTTTITPPSGAIAALQLDPASGSGLGITYLGTALSAGEFGNQIQVGDSFITSYINTNPSVSNPITLATSNSGIRITSYDSTNSVPSTITLDSDQVAVTGETNFSNVTPPTITNAPLLGDNSNQIPTTAWVNTQFSQSNFYYARVYGYVGAATVLNNPLLFLRLNFNCITTGTYPANINDTINIRFYIRINYVPTYTSGTVTECTNYACYTGTMAIWPMRITANTSNVNLNDIDSLTGSLGAYNSTTRYAWVDNLTTSFITAPANYPVTVQAVASSGAPAGTVVPYIRINVYNPDTSSNAAGTLSTILECELLNRTASTNGIVQITTTASGSTTGVTSFVTNMY